MTTFVYDLVNSIDDRWHEVRILVERAAEEQHTNSDLYDALCRASVLLIVAHLEGFIKESAKAIIYDLNKFSRFRDSPSALKRTFCRSFVGAVQEEGKDLEARIKKLIQTLEGLETQFLVEPFLIETSYGNNKTPSPHVINRICSNFGVRNIFSWLNNSSLDIVFSGVSSEIELLLSKLRNYILSKTVDYPYGINISDFGIIRPDSKHNENRSFWETFLDQLVRYRNDIAHGSSLNNSFSVEDLIEFQNKVIMLKYGLILILCYQSMND